MIEIEVSDLQSILHRIRTNVGILLGATGAAAALGFATVALNARAIGAEGVGVIALLQALAAIVSGLFYVGSQQPLIRLGRQAINENHNDRLGVITGLALLVDATAAALAGLVAIVLVWSAPAVVGISETTQRLALIYTVVIFFSGNAASQGILRLLNRFHYIGLLQVTDALLIFVAAGLLFYSKAEVGAYVVAYAAIHTVTAGSHVVLALILLRRAGIAVHFRPSTIRKARVLREYLSYAWTTTVTSALDTLRRNADTLLVGAFLGPALVGIYSVVKQIAGVFNKVLIPVSSAVFPEVAGLAARADVSIARGLLNKLALLGFALGACGAVIMAIGGGLLLRYGFGPEFQHGHIALVAIMIAVSLNLSGASFGGFVQAFHSPIRLLHIYLGGSLLFAVCAPSLIWALGIVGGALSQAVFSSIHWFGCWATLSRLLPKDPKLTAKLSESAAGDGRGRL